MTNLIEKLDRAYKLSIKTINGDPEVRQINFNEVPIYGAKPLIKELDKGLDSSRERTFFLFRDKYFLGIQKGEGASLEDSTPYGFVKTIIQIPEKRHVNRTDYNWGPKPTLKLIDSNLWPKCLENRKKVLDQIVEKYKLETYWNDDSAFDYLLGQIIGGYNHLKGKKFVDLDEKEAVKKSENFMNALREWAYNDPMA